MQHDQRAEFVAGLEILRPFFESEGFELVVHPPHETAEGTRHFAQFVWDTRSVTLMHVSRLESVSYAVGGMMIGHEAYLDALDVRRDAAFPPETDGPLDGYHALLSDLQTRMTPFFDEPDREFMDIAMTHGERGRPWVPEAR